MPSSNATTVQIIISKSFFTGLPVVGLAFAGDKTPCNFTKWADALPHGRPATIQPLNGRPQADQITYLTARWVEWSQRTGVALQINTKPRRVRVPF